VPSDRTRGNRHKLKHGEVLSEHEEELFHYEGDGALEQVAQRGCGFCCSGDIQDSPQQGPVQPALGDNYSAHLFSDTTPRSFNTIKSS